MTKHKLQYQNFCRFQTGTTLLKNILEVRHSYSNPEAWPFVAALSTLIRVNYLFRPILSSSMHLGISPRFTDLIQLSEVNCSLLQVIVGLRSYSIARCELNTASYSRNTVIASVFVKISSRLSARPLFDLWLITTEFDILLSLSLWLVSLYQSVSQSTVVDILRPILW